MSLVHELRLGPRDACIRAVWIQVVFLDDIGANLQPARDLGMVTILVHDPDRALRELERVTGMQVTASAPSGFLFGISGRQTPWEEKR